MSYANRLVAGLLVVTTLAGIAFAYVYATSAQVQLTALLLVIGFGTFAAAMIAYEHELMPRNESIEARGLLPSGDDANAAAAALLSGANEIARSRPWLLKLFAGAAATFGIAVLFPLRSLAPKLASPTDLAHTSWRKGMRLVREDGTLVHASELGVDSIVTVFPEGHVGPQFVNAMANDATVLVRIPERELHLPADRAAWAPDGLVALSKVCTHAGCPVALYRAAARQLFCPCHQSTFDVLTGGNRIFGPAVRGLPQLPLRLLPDGTLEALGDFPDPIGPGYWERA
ncbi:MAG: Rieske 2Fe-2S domain-containing protein [Candidatus Eremiobacteraeota bacterium]|nr:Rieske 2Fe-2S domain-containing protein [Candidatus Eremiobacteraeota bacterium]